MDQRLTRRAVAASAGAAALAVTIGTTARGQEAASPVASPRPGVLPDTPAGNQLAWVLDVLNGDAPMPDEAGIREHFSEATLALLPADQLIATFRQLTTLAPLSAVEVVGYATPLGIDALVETNDGAQMLVMLAVDRDEPHFINSLVFLPQPAATPEIPALSGWSDLDEALAAFGPNAAVYAAPVAKNGEADPVHELNPEEAMPIGSAFKLYVLGAVADAIAREELAWDTEVEVTENVISLPSGVTQYELFGTKLPVEELARRMISISDNTATDMLIHTVGREACEAMLEPMGNSVPERNMPFLTTREMFTVKLGDPELLDAYAAGDAAERRAMLDTIAGEPLPPVERVLAWSAPIAINEVEWFATMKDLGRAMTRLLEVSQESSLEPIREILTINPGIPLEEDAWPLVAFKGGSEPGVMALSWLVERSDGERFTYALAVSNPDALVDEQAVSLAAAGAFPLLAGA